MNGDDWEIQKPGQRILCEQDHPKKDVGVRVAHANDDVI